MPYSVDERHRLMHAVTGRGKLSNQVERSDVDRFDPDRALGEPDATGGYTHLGPWASEAIRFEC